MKKANSLLFLYMVPQTGHQKAAEAIAEAASQMDPRLAVQSIDAVGYVYPVLGNVVNKMYLQMLKKAPFIWEYLYDNPGIEEATRDARGLLTFISSFKIKKLIRKYSPSAIVCTQAVPAVAIAAAKRNGETRVPLIGVITDFGVHAYWLHPEVDLYLVGHEDVKKEMIRKGIDEKKIRVTGIPIHPRFGKTPNTAEARRHFKLHAHKPTLLIMGGSHGLGQLDELVEALIQLPDDFQAMIVCGKNVSLQKKIGKMTRAHPSFHVMGYLKDTALAMDAVDILVSKPGGLTCSEALAKQVPLVVTNPLPGQEERNVRFLLRYQLARVAQSNDELFHHLTDLIRHPSKREALRRRARLVGKPHSAWEAAHLIFDQLK